MGNGGLERRFEALDSWRGIAATLVMLFHFSLAINWSFRDSPLVRHPDVLITFFFVLSGFVISHAYERKLSGQAGGVVPFVMRRFGRLYPLHLVTLVAMVGWAVARSLVEGGPIFDGNAYDFSAIFTNLLMLHGTGVENHFTWNFPSWSISAEFYTYIIFAVVWALLGARALLGVAAILIAATVFNLTSALPGISVKMLTICVCGFAAGALAERLYRVTSETALMDNRVAATAFECGALAIVAATIMVREIPAGLLPLAYAPVVYVFAFEKGLLSTLLRTRLPRGLGTLSYSVYMIHAPILIILGGVLAWLDAWLGLGMRAPFTGIDEPAIARDQWLGNLVVACLVALTLLIGTLTYRFIEVPGREWGGRLAQRWRNRSLPAPADA